MAGGIAHIVLSSVLRGSDRLGEIASLGTYRLAVTRYGKYCELGSISPDYPYLGHQSAWADAMHYTHTGRMIAEGVRILRGWPEGPAKDVAVTWLLGYAAHVGTDIVIHPVVEMKVGEYAEHKSLHRRCEMHQDVWAWHTLRMGTLDDVEYLRNGLGTCTDRDGGLNDDVEALWRGMLEACHADLVKSEPPNFDTWHRSYTRMVEVAYSIGGKNPIFALGRHVLDGLALHYPDIEEIDKQFIENLPTPDGPMHYDKVFGKAVEFVTNWWAAIGTALHAPDDEALNGALAVFVDANLDTGIPERNSAEYIAWAPAERVVSKLPA